MKEIKDRCISKKEYLQKYDSNVGYALYVQDNIKKDDYARLNTGEIVRVIGIRENNVNKKAIYYGIYETDWFDSSATENFSDNIKDLIECGDYVNGHRIIMDLKQSRKHYGTADCFVTAKGYTFEENEIKTILTKEQYMQNCYKLD